MSALVMMALVAFGLLIGLSMGAVGAGGSIVAVPVLVYVAGQPPKEATASALVVVLLTSLVALRPHWTQHRVRLDVAVPFALAGFGGAAVGALTTKQVPGDVLMLAFSGVLACSALLLFRRNRATSRPAVSHDGLVTAAVSSTVSVSAVALHTRAAEDERGRVASVVSSRTSTAHAGSNNRGAGSPRAPFDGGIGAGDGDVPDGDVPDGDVPDGAADGRSVRLRAVGKILLVGALVGTLTGAFGVGGGFVIVPALALLLGLPMTQAVGTSLLVIAANGAFTFLLKAGDTPLDWSVIAIFSGAAAVGALAGGEVSRRFDGVTLTRWFVRGVVAVACYTAIRSILDLVG
ncbi:MAG: TSUP family transporter [Acidimicrobiales bacterium]